MAVTIHLRTPGEYRVVFGFQRGGGQPITRVDTGLTAMWHEGELVIPINASNVDDVLRIVGQTVRRETAGPGASLAGPVEEA